MQELQETRVRSLGREDPLEEDVAPLSSSLARKLPQTEEPGKLQSTGQKGSGTTEHAGMQDCLFILRRESSRGGTFHIQRLMTRNRYDNPCPFC